ncbi:MAG: ribose 5-phosphate isomerase B [candidate division Zixibacteria bacterium RBG_16_53_22]|nr:MAG: ribose 5-phosphate isomerase B [candidate division Zixibacteria bacterium RBG_16_53_22]
MKVAMTSDHAGYQLKQAIVSAIESDGHELIDLGTNSEEPVDYPDFALRIALVIAGGDADRGIFICGSGVGGNVAVNKVPGIRAGLCHDTYSAHQGVEHDNMNILCLGSRVVGKELAIELCRAFLNAEFSNEDRHIRRLEKIEEIENRFNKPLGDTNP